MPGLQTNLCRYDSDCVDKIPVGMPAICGSVWEKAGLDPVLYDGVRANELILYGIPGFDNFGQGLFTVFQVCTLESWAYLMNNFAASSSDGFLAYIYFPVIIFLGGFFTMNLILA